MAQLQAGQDQINHMVNRCNEAGEGLTTGMAQLLDRIQSLGGAGMRGSANNALQGVSAELSAGMRTITNALAELADNIRRASTSYATQDEDAATDIRQAAEGTGNSSVISALRG